MQNLKLKYFLLGGVLLGPIIAFAFLSLRSAAGSPDSDYVLIEKAAKDVRCPDGATMVYEPWGESGRMAKCQLAHGALIAAEHGKIIFKREYAMGKLISEEKAP
jgi:hypothetical protein